MEEAKLLAGRLLGPADPETKAYESTRFRKTSRVCGGLVESKSKEVTLKPGRGPSTVEERPSPSPEDLRRARNRWSSGDLLR